MNRNEKKELKKAYTSILQTIRAKESRKENAFWEYNELRKIENKMSQYCLEPNIRGAYIRWR